MGLYHIVTIGNDSLEINKDRRDEVEKELGKAIFTLCADPQYGYLRPPKIEKVTSASVLNCGSAVHHCAELHSTEYEAMVFSRCSLRSVKDLNGEERSELIAYIQNLPPTLESNF